MIEIFFLSAAVFFCLISLFSAIYAAPYSIDALIYHLSSAMHWIQNKTINVYPTAIARQLVDPLFSSFMQLHLFLLNGNDHWANFPQFISMLLSLVCLSLLCRNIGLTRKEALCAISLAAALPLGVLQASSPLNDYTVSFWVISFIFFFYKHLHTKNTFDLAVASISFAFIFLTKADGLVIAMPFLIYFMVSEHKNNSFVKSIFIFGGVFLVFSFPFICRLAAVYPLLKTPYANSPLMSFSLAHPRWGLWENIFRHILIEASFYRGNEMTMSDPLCLLSMLGAGIWLALKYKNIPSSIRVYTLLLCSGFLSLCILSKASVWACRFHLPVLILFCPLIAFVLLKFNGFYKIALPLILCFCAFTVIYYSGRYPFDYRIRTWMPRDLQFKRPFYPDGLNFYLASQEAALLPCPDIGLKTYGGGDQKEYMLWQMMRRKHRPFRIEHVDVQNYSKNFPYPLGPFDPCAIILTKLHGNLPPSITLNRPFRLFKNYGNTGLYTE